jgi:hypothetical protein
MPSSGSSTDITRQDANDLLQKFISERIRVQAVFVGRGSVSASTAGFVKRREDGMVGVSEGNVNDPCICFGLTDVSCFKYGDNRIFAERSNLPGAPHFASALLFVYPDGTQIALFEIETREIDIMLCSDSVTGFKQ